MLAVSSWVPLRLSLLMKQRAALGAGGQRKARRGEEAGTRMTVTGRTPRFVPLTDYLTSHLSKQE